MFLYLYYFAYAFLFYTLITEVTFFARFALACLIVKEEMQLSDRDTVALIRENPYVQYFLGCDSYNYDLSLDASLLTYFRKRFPAQLMAQVNQWIIEAATIVDEDESNDDDPDDENDQTVDSN